MMSIIKTRIVPTLLVAAFTVPLYAGTDAQSSIMLARALALLSGGKLVQEVKLEGSVNYFAGSDEESGLATLEASGQLASRRVLNLSGGQRVEIQNGTQATWSGPDGKMHLQSLHNCMNWAVWFFPALAIGGVVQDASYTATYIGPDTYAGSPVQHLRIFRQPAGQGDAATMKMLLDLTTTDLYLDASTFLPTALEYNIHPDNNGLQNIPVKVEFTSYQSVDGVQAPFHIRQFLQGSLLLDITLSSATINPSLPPGNFSIE